MKFIDASQRSVLKIAHFRWYLSQCLFSSIGGGLSYVAMTWMVIGHTHQVMHVALLMFCFWGASIVLGPLIGVWVDRVPSQRIIQITNGSRAAITMLFALCYWQGASTWAIFVLAIATGILSAFYNPAAVKWVAATIAPTKRISANSLVDICIELGALIGMALAGFAIALMGSSGALLTSGVLFAIGTLALIPIKGHTRKLAESDSHGHAPIVSRSVWAELKDSLDYFKSNKPLIYIYTAQACAFICFWTTPIITAPFAKQILHANSAQFGMIEACLSIGVVIGGLSVPTLVKRCNIKVVIVTQNLCVALAFLLFWVDHSLILTEILYGIVGFGFASWALIVSSAQNATRLDYQGRLQATTNLMASLGMVIVYLMIIAMNHYVSVQTNYIIEVILACITMSLVLIYNPKSMEAKLPHSATE